MENTRSPEKPALEQDALADLRMRLDRLRSRMAAEGREAAVTALDNAIEREHRRQTGNVGHK